jgi:hypothetical protein
MADKGIPFDVPTRANLLQGQRLIDEQLREKAARDAKLSPLDKAYAALEAARTFGSGILATVGSLPTRAIKGEDAAQEYINQRMYIPTTEKGMDYVGNVGNFLEQLETKYKLPPVLPEAVALQNVMGPAAKQATKQAAKAAKPVVGKALEEYMFKQGLAMPVVNPASNKPGIIVSNLIDEEPDIAKRLGAQARANRQAALEAEGRRKELAAQTQPSVGYRTTTEKNPDPLVGTRFVNEQATGLNPNEPFDISKFQGANALVLPWDSQSRNVKTTQVSGVDLPNQIFRKTHGGVPYSFDTGHVKKGIAGASGSEIAKRVKTRSDVATQESLGRGGTGEVLHFPITMGFRGEDYALPYSEFVFDMINNKLITGELTQKQADELSDMVRNFTPPISKYKGQKPFAEFKGFTNPEGLDQIYTGEGMNVPSGELRKAIADRLIWQKGSQEKLGFNAEDLMNATTYEPLRGVGKGVIGASVIRNTPTGMKLTPSPWKFPYDTDFSGEHLGRLNDLVDVEALFYRTMNPIKQELMQRENKIPYTKESLRNAAIGAIEKRNEAVSQPIDQQFLDDYANYVNELNKPHEYRSGGLVSDNPDVMMMELEDKKFAIGGIAKKTAKTAAKTAVKEPAVNRLDMNFKDVTKRIPELTEAANMVAKGQMTASEYASLVQKLKPVTPYNFVPQPATTEDAMRALTENKKPMFGKTKEMAAGEQADLRLDIPAYKDHGVWVNSIHRKDQPTVYGSTSSVKNATMIGAPEKAMKVAQGGPKAPFAVIRGDWNPMDESEAIKNAQKYLDHPDWKQVGYDPERHGYFYDRASMAPVIGADEVIQIGPLVLAKKPKYGNPDDFDFKSGGAITKDKKFGIGGMAGKAVKSAVATRELEKAAKITAEMAAKKAAKDALMPQYNEAVKGQTQKQKPLSFEQWKAINYPEGTQGLQNAPQKQTFKYPQESLPAEESEENLQKFLGNSRIRDRLYHATPKNFSEFKPGGDDPTISGPAIWLTPNATKQPAAHNISSRSQKFREGTNVMPVYVQARSPLMLDDKLAIEWAREVYADGSREFPDLLSPKTIEELKKGGYDSIIHADPYGNRGGEQEIIMFEPNKIKSAIGNRGTYDIEDADITKASGGSVNLDAMYMAVNDAKFRRK